MAVIEVDLGLLVEARGGVERDGHPLVGTVEHLGAHAGGGLVGNFDSARAPSRMAAGGSLAGKDSASASSYRLPMLTGVPRAGAGASGSESSSEMANRALGLAERDAVLRAGGARDRRLDRRQVELERLGERRLGGGVVPQALLLGVGLDEGDAGPRPGR